MTVEDTTAPVVTAPAAVTAEAAGAETAVEIGSATAVDLVDGAVAVSSDAPASYPVGTTVVTWTATDAAGNTGSATQNVTVEDTTAPVVTAPAAVTAEAAGAETAVEIGSATAVDLVDGAVAVSSDAPASYPVGTTVVTWTATDAAGNTATATQNVTVEDTTAPVVTAPAAVTAEAAGAETAVEIGSATAVDLVDGAVAVSSDAPASYPVGTTVVTWTATDAAGNTGSATQNVTVEDTTAPVVTAPANVSAEATAAETSLDIGTATATDEVGVVSITSDAPASYPVGTTVVTWTATDAAGNTATAMQNVTVADTTAPVVTAPADVSAEAAGEQTAVEIGTATATDEVGVVSITSDAPATYPVGTTVVTWTATDAAGNTATAMQNVTVADTTAPVVTAPANVSAEAAGEQTAVEIGTATATDEVGVVSITSDAPATYPVGTTVVTWTATDAAGNTATATQNVTVEDTTAPVVTCPNDITVRVNTPASDPDVAQFLENVTAFDLVDQNVVITNNVPSVFSLPPNSHQVTFTATDNFGNQSTCDATVSVQYIFSGFLPPLNTDRPFKLRSTIPVKFRLTDIAGRYISTAAATIMLHKYSNNEPDGEPIEVYASSAANAGSQFRYDTENEQYIFNLSTAGLSKGSWLVRVLLDDGTEKSIMVKLK